MTDDLCKRLRDRYPLATHSLATYDECVLAASTIEAQAREIAGLQKRKHSWEFEFARRLTAERQLAEAVKVLKPFSDAEEYVGERMPDNSSSVMLYALGINIGDIRRARTFLASLSPEESRS